jgi:hypothetical protein
VLERCQQKREEEGLKKKEKQKQEQRAILSRPVEAAAKDPKWMRSPFARRRGAADLPKEVTSWLPNDLTGDKALAGGTSLLLTQSYRATC